MDASKAPEFDDLPEVKGMPKGCAWGLWDKDGQRDSLGTLNFLTPKVALEAKKLMVDGDSVALNWPSGSIEHPGFGRKPLHRKEINWKDFSDFYAHDDEIEFNTQSGSQWDGFKHWAHQATGMYYNGLSHDKVRGCTDNGVHFISKRGGMVGRGVLLDYVAFAERKGIKYDPWTRHEIYVKDLEEIAKEQNVELKPADILIIRSGWVKRFNEASHEQRISGVKEGHYHVGVLGNEETVRWLWKHRFSAIAGDTIAWEAWPPQPFDWAVHDWSLALHGRPIGELWDLEELAARCEKKKRWEFLFTSAPLNIIGGVASPPNALAIF